MKKNTLKQLLMSSNYFVLNKKIIKTFGIETGYLLTALIEASDMLADEDGWFFQTIENIEEITTLNRYKQDKGIKDLLNSGILEQTNMGVPCRRFFRINYEEIVRIVFENGNNQQTSLQNFNKLDCENSTTQFVENSQTGLQNFNKLYINKKTINKKYKEININNILPPIIPPGDNLLKPKKRKKEKIVETEIETQEINAIIDYLNQRVGSSLKKTGGNTRNLIKARLNEGYSVGDIIAVLDEKAKEWLNDEKMQKYLVPSTLFRKSNFEKYIQGLIIKTNLKRQENEEMERWLQE